MCPPHDDQPGSQIGPIPTGFRDIDAALDGGLQPGSLTVIAGHTGSGVTALATHVATQLVTLGDGAANIHSLDCPVYRLDLRIRTITVPPADQSYDDNRRDLYGGRLRILGGHDRKPWDILRNLTLDLWTSKPRANLIVVDSLNMVGVVGDDLAFPRSPKTHSPVMIDFCRHLKGLALDENIAIIATTTFGVDARTGTEPDQWIQHLPAVGPAAVAADNVLLLYRPDRWDRRTPRAGEVDFVLAKGSFSPKLCTVGHQITRGKFIDFPIGPQPGTT